MLVKLFGNTELVSSAIALSMPFGIKYLINAADRSCYFHRSGGSVLAQQYFGEKAPPQHETFLVYQEDSEGDIGASCEVVFIAENWQDKQAMFDGTTYDHTERGQYTCVSIRRALSCQSETLCAHPVIVPETARDGLSVSP